MGGRGGGDGRGGEEEVGRERREGEGEGQREGRCRKKLLMYPSTRLELRTPI